MTTEVSTPSTSVDNTSEAELTDVNTLDNSELKTEILEAETEENPVNVPEQPKTEPIAPQEKLIFGKFKDMEAAETAYKEAERAIRDKAEYEKQLAIYRDQEAKARLERETLAHQNGFDSAESQQLDADIKKFEYLRYVEALEMGYCGENYENAVNALRNYQISHNLADLAEAKKCFDAEAIEKIASSTALYRNQKTAEFSQTKQTQLFENVKGSLASFAKETGDWLDVEERGAVVAQAVNLAGPNVDLKMVKELIDKVEAKAIDRFQAEQKVLSENRTQIGKLQSPTGGSPTAKEASGDWHELSEEDLDKEVDNYFKEKNK